MIPHGWKTLSEVAKEKGVCHAGLRHRVEQWEASGWAVKPHGIWIIGPEAQASVGTKKKSVPKPMKTDEQPNTEFIFDREGPCPEYGIKRLIMRVADSRDKEVERQIRADERQRVERDVAAAFKEKMKFLLSLLNRPHEFAQVAEKFGLVD